MAASVVHFGDDVCFRLPVLRSAGYSVATCDSLELLSMTLTWDFDAVIVEEKPRALTRDAVSLIRSRSRASVILFRTEIDNVIPGELDLVIPTLTAPEAWLSEIAALIQWSQQLRAESQALSRQAVALRENSVAIRKIFRENCARSIRQRSRSFEDSWSRPEPPPDGSKFD
ncbi:MAG TPA: hypothetical protein VGM02_15940 [Acidobacteriaceae bacterium]|jgi:hypothetical protein